MNEYGKTRIRIVFGLALFFFFVWLSEDVFHFGLAGWFDRTFGKSGFFLYYFFILTIFWVIWQYSRRKVQETIKRGEDRIQRNKYK